jgi:hypothetical protein
MNLSEKEKIITDRWDVKLYNYEPNGSYEIFEEGKPYLHVFHKFFKIKSGKHLYIVVCKLIHLNPDLEFIDILDITRFIANSANQISVFSFSDNLVEELCANAWRDVKEGKIEIEYQMRKVFFSKKCKLSDKARRRITGRASSSTLKVKHSDLWDAINEYKENDIIIDNTRLSMSCNCSKKTISRRITPAMKREISFHNKKMRIKYNRRHY